MQWEGILRTFPQLSQRTQVDVASGDLKGLPAVTPAQPADFPAFSKFPIFPGMIGAEIRGVLDEACTFVLSRKMFPHTAGEDITQYVARWSTLFQRITDIEETKVPLDTRKRAIDFVFQMFDLSGRVVVKKGRSFKADGYKGDEAAFDRASLFVLFTECGPQLAKVVIDSVAGSQASSGSALAKDFARVVTNVRGGSAPSGGASGPSHADTFHRSPGRGRGRTPYAPRGRYTSHMRPPLAEPAPFQYAPGAGPPAQGQYFEPMQQDYFPAPPHKRPYNNMGTQPPGQK